MHNAIHEFKEFMQQREAAARAYVQGDAEPLGRLVTRVSPATFFSPRGDYLEGADAVSTRYQRDAAAFQLNSNTHFQILHMAASDGIAYWVGFQRASVQMQGKSDPIPFNLRVTEVFRRDGDAWTLIHRHADTLLSESENESQ